MLIYRMYWNSRIESKEVLDRETESSYFYKDRKGNEVSRRKSTSYEKWFKTEKEAVADALSDLQQKLLLNETLVIGYKKEIEEFKLKFKDYL